MLKISTKTSVNLSIIMSIAFFAVIVVGAVILPAYVASAVELPLDRLPENAKYDKYILISLGYAALAIVTSINIMLLKLLFRVRVDLVFTEESISLIRFISWCAILLGAVFFILGFYFLISYFAAFACLFLGICLRVVKNVIEKATEIKAENDFTI